MSDPHCPLVVGDSLTIGQQQLATVSRRLGRGGFATVWAADCQHIDTAVAVKAYRANHESYFRNELAILSHIRDATSPNWPAGVIEYYGSFNHGVYPCITFAVGGESLSQLTRVASENGSGLSPAIVKQIMRQMFAGLAAIHSCGIIHMDIKPSNVLLSGRATDVTEDNVCISIADLGSSQFVGDPPHHATGTTQYISPEILLETAYDASRDIWSAFAMCFELATNDLLFDVFHECAITYGEEMDEDAVDDESMDDPVRGRKLDRSMRSRRDSTPKRTPEYVTSRGAAMTSESESDEPDSYESIYRHLLIMDRIIGPAPRRFTAIATNFYNAQGRLLDHPDLEHITITDLLMMNYDMDSVECHELGAFLEAGIRYNGSERPTAADALMLPYLVSPTKIEKSSQST
jgi:serine/threonine protein kinase